MRCIDSPTFYSRPAAPGVQPHAELQRVRTLPRTECVSLGALCVASVCFLFLPSIAPAVCRAELSAKTGEARGLWNPPRCDIRKGSCSLSGGSGSHASPATSRLPPAARTAPHGQPTDASYSAWTSAKAITPNTADCAFVTRVHNA